MYFFVFLYLFPKYIRFIDKCAIIGVIILFVIITNTPKVIPITPSSIMRGFE